MASPTQWTLVWVDSKSWCWTGRPGMLQPMGSQRVGHDWVTELNWTSHTHTHTHTHTWSIPESLMKPKFSGLPVHFLITTSERKSLPQERKHERILGAIQGEPSVCKGERRGLWDMFFPDVSTGCSQGLRAHKPQWEAHSIYKCLPVFIFMSLMSTFFSQA